jgi:hypothetical protein
MNTLMSAWLYGSAFVLATYWYVAISHLLRGRVTVADLPKMVGISLLLVLVWPYVFLRWLWCLLKGDLTRDVIIDPIDTATSSDNKDQE